MVRLLLLEFIHADDAAYTAAPSGLRVEGRAMLDAVVSDAAEAQGVAPTVLLCESALADGGGLAGIVDVWVSDSRQSLVDQLAALSGCFDAVLPIVPECDQLLPHVALLLESASLRILLPSLEFVQVCSDKLSTWRVLGDAGVPMLDCIDVDSCESSTGAADSYVFKDRWGAGCEGIQRGQSIDADLSGVICQRWIEAESLSVGVIGNGTKTFVLPIAHQRIHWTDGRPDYLGGAVPATTDRSITQQVNTITQQVLEFAGGFAGYLGIDFLVETETVFLNEVNPRLCTSYIGYRRLLNSNVVELMLSRASMDAVSLRSTQVSFDKSGATTCPND